MEFTDIGDTVNTVSRFFGLAKGRQILATRGRDVLEFVDLLLIFIFGREIAAQKTSSASGDGPSTQIRRNGPPPLFPDQRSRKKTIDNCQ
jgi:hypothetical protein